ncbi:MAG: PQQ-binding-like beta-propeller repeat protein [Acidobacteria bacterium]|nr:PQQ-binding-like beta-propeller repeat protein [Acidobacteriota bacterium]
MKLSAARLVLLCAVLSAPAAGTGVVVGWSRVLDDDLPGAFPPVAYGARSFSDGSVLFTSGGPGALRVVPGGRVQTYATAPVVDSEERLFALGSESFDRLDPATGLSMLNVKGTYLGTSRGALIVLRRLRLGGLSVLGLSPRDGLPLWGPLSFPHAAYADLMAQSGRIGFLRTSRYSVRADELVLEGVVTAVDLETGEALWTRPFERRGPSALGGSGSGCGGVYLVESSGYGLIRIDAETGRTVWHVALPRHPNRRWQQFSSVLASERGVVVRWDEAVFGTGGRLAKLDPATGAVRFHVALDAGAGRVEETTDGNLVVPVSRGGTLVMQKLHGANGRLIAQSTFEAAGETFLAVRALEGGAILLHTFASAGPEVVSRYLSADLTLSSAAVRTGVPGPGYGRWPSNAQIASTPRGLLVEGHGLAVFERGSGDALVSKAFERGEAPGLVTSDGALVHVVQGSIFKRSGATGEILWSSLRVGPVWATPEPILGLASNGDVLSLEGAESSVNRRFVRRAAGDGTVLVRSSSRIPMNGPARIWGGTRGAYIAALVEDPRRIELRLVDEEDGSILWMRRLSGAVVPPAFVDSSGDLILRDGERVERVSAETGVAQWSVAVSREASIAARGTDVIVLKPDSFLRLSSMDGRVLVARPLPEEALCPGWNVAMAGKSNLWAACPAKAFVALLDVNSGAVRGTLHNFVQTGGLGIVTDDRDAYVLRAEERATIFRLAEGPGAGPVPLPSLACGDDVQLVIPFGPRDSTLRVVEGALPSGLSLSAITGHLHGTLTSDGVHDVGLRVVGPDGVPDGPVSRMTFRIAPAPGSELVLQASAFRMKPGETVRLSIPELRPDSEGSVKWTPGGEGSHEIVVRPKASTRFSALLSVPGACPRRGAVVISVDDEEPVLAGAGFYTIEPCRLLDSRTDLPDALTDGIPRSVAVFGRCGVPRGAVALAVNVTAVDATRN